jgi:ABC-type antimicrobial peptide transport system permease subunit
MILLQATLVWFVGFSAGSALTATFFNITLQQLATRHMVFLPESLAGVAVFMLLVVLASSAAGLRRVWQLEPAEVFRG